MYTATLLTTTAILLTTILTVLTATAILPITIITLLTTTAIVPTATASVIRATAMLLTAFYFFLGIYLFAISTIKDGRGRFFFIITIK
ncbi:MAG: hypothetical protein NTX03_11795 [Bacteroidetes bacterium]|nr:hypothetical protein [Bacteroidota bacterium]